MKQNTLEAISITALVISVIVLVVLIFMMIKGHLSARGGIVKMDGGKGHVGNRAGVVLIRLEMQLIAYNPDNQELIEECWHNIETGYQGRIDMNAVLYAIFMTAIVDDKHDSRVHQTALEAFERCRGKFDTSAPLIRRTVEMLDNDLNKLPNLLLNVYDLDDEWLATLKIPMRNHPLKAFRNGPYVRPDPTTMRIPQAL